MCTAVHVILYILAGFSLEVFLYLFPDIQCCLGDASQQKEIEKEREKGQTERELHELLYTD